MYSLSFEKLECIYEIYIYVNKIHNTKIYCSYLQGIRG